MVQKMFRQSVLAMVTILGLGLIISGHVKYESRFPPLSNYGTQLISPSLAQANPCGDGYVAQGRLALRDGNLIAANTFFAQALDCDPNHTQANFFYATTRLLSLLYSDEANEIMDRFGINAVGRDISLWTADFQYDVEGEIIWPADTPTVDELIGTLNTAVLPEIEGAIANLDKIDSGFNEIMHQDEILTDIPMEADYGDVLAFAAVLKAAKSAIKILNAYNLSLDIDELIMRTNNQDITNINEFLDFYPDFFTLRTGAVTQLAESKAALKEAIEEYFAASGFIRSEVDGQNDDIVVFDPDEPMEEERFRMVLGKIKDTLEGPQQFCGETNGYYNLVVSGDAGGFIRFERDLCESFIGELGYEDFNVTGDGGGAYSGVEAILPFADSFPPPLRYFPPQTGYTWSYVGNKNSYAVKSTSVIISTSETVSVTAGNFSNCVKVEETLLYPPEYIPSQAYPVKFERWFAPGVGPVKLLITQNDGGMYGGQLTSYQNIPDGQNDYFPLGLDYTWTFTMNGGRSATWVVNSAREEMEHFTVDGSKFFNGLDIQEYLPDFDGCGRPVYGTLPDSTFNGLLPDFSRDYWWKNIFSLSKYYVNAATGNDENIGNSPASALKTISEAARRADNWGFGSEEQGCEIVINAAAGTYNRASGENFPIELEENIDLHGAGADSTTIDASGGTDSVIYIERGTLDGFTITGGNGYRAGGVDLEEATLSNCIVTGNTAYRNGAGISAYDSLIKNCTISNNNTTADWSSGGGIDAWRSIISECIVRNNFTGNNGRGGGIYAYESVIERCRIIDNNSRDGGGLWIRGWSRVSRIVNNVISRNSATNRGGGIYINYPSSPVEIINCSLYTNIAPIGPGIEIRGWSGSAEVRVTNTIVWGSGVNPIHNSYNGPLIITYSDIQGGWPGEGNIGDDPNDNPFFVDQDNGDYRLQSGSPCIDTGTSTGAPADDIEGIARPHDGDGLGAGSTGDGSDYDMGTYEYFTGCPHDGDVNEDGKITPQDALMAFRYYLEIIELNECQQDRADVNDDGSVTPADALCIFRKYLELSSCLD